MFYPYFIGLFIGIQIGKGYERINSLYYYHIDKIINQENTIKEYERLFGKINYVDSEGLESEGL